MEVSAGVVKKTQDGGHNGAIEAPSDAHKNLHLDFFDHILQALLGGEKREADRYLAQSSRTDWQAAPGAQGSGFCAPHLL